MTASQDRSIASAGRVIDGLLEPEKIRDSVKYGLLISGYELRVRGQLEDRLSTQDRQVLTQLAIQDLTETEADTNEYVEARKRLCAKRKSMTPVEIAHEWTWIAKEWERKREARYRKGLESLSHAGRRIVEEFIATEIVPGTKTMEPADALEQARKDPEGFMEAVYNECYMVETGELPPEVQLQYEEFVREHNEED